MNILITAGNTLVLIDKVRAITNIFSGRTGAAIAHCAAERGHQVTLLTSQADTAHPATKVNVVAYRTFTELETLLHNEVCSKKYDAVIHSAAVSDYEPAGIYAPDDCSRFDETDLSWRRNDSGHPQLESRAAGKVKSDAPELWLRLQRTPKLVDKIRREWGFRGILVKFKLEVDLDEKMLLERAELSRRQSDADLMVANTLEGMASSAYVGSGRYDRIDRALLPGRLMRTIESLHEEKRHG
jgi:phosphopantothenoylcysteine synthetase/decarboxylase